MKWRDRLHPPPPHPDLYPNTRSNHLCSNCVQCTGCARRSTLPRPVTREELIAMKFGRDAAYTYPPPARYPTVESTEGIPEIWFRQPFPC